MYDSKSENKESSINSQGHCVKDRSYFKGDNFGYMSARNSHIPIENLLTDINNNYLK